MRAVLLLTAGVMIALCSYDARASDVFEREAQAAREALRPVSVESVAPALSQLGCRVLVSRDSGPGIMVVGERIIQSDSMGQIAYATCPGGMQVTLRSTRSLEQMINGKPARITSEVILPEETSTRGMRFGSRLVGKDKGVRMLSVSWRNSVGRQFVLSRYDQAPMETAKPAIEHMAKLLSESNWLKADL